MRRIFAFFMALLLIPVILCACGKSPDGETDRGSYTVEANDSGVLKTYSYDADTGKYTCEGIEYDFRLTLSGRMPSAVEDSSYVVLSDRQDVTFEETYKQFISSDTADWFDPQDAVVVEMR